MFSPLGTIESVQLKARIQYLPAELHTVVINVIHFNFHGSNLIKADLSYCSVSSSILHSASETSTFLSLQYIVSLFNIRLHLLAVH